MSNFSLSYRAKSGASGRASALPAIVSSASSGAIAKGEISRLMADDDRGEAVFLFAAIRTDSKYFGQTSPGELFPVSLRADAGGYPLVGGPGGAYRLSDVHLFVCGEDALVRVS